MDCMKGIRLWEKTKYLNGQKNNSLSKRAVAWPEKVRILLWGWFVRRVIEAFRTYLNQVGGFGNALEPDIRCLYSQPVPTEMALMIMDEADGFDPQILEGIIRFLRNITLRDGGIPFVFRNAGAYPYASWWFLTGVNMMFRKQNRFA